MSPAVEGDGPRGADQFIRDDRTEKVLADAGVTFTFETVDLTDIDLTVLDRGEPERQMRDEIVHADVASRYADDLEYGQKFPAGVLSGGNVLRIVDFHHRLWAARAAKLTQVSAYVVPNLDDFDMIELGNVLNRNHGVPLADPERIRQALWGLQIGRFKTIRHAARVLGVAENKLGNAKKRVDAVDKAEELGVSKTVFEKLPTAAQVRLGSIQSPEVFKAAALSATGKGLGAKEVNELVTQVNDAPGDQAKLDVVREYGADIAPRNVFALSDPWNRLHTACRSVLTIDMEPLVRSAMGRDGEVISNMVDEIEATMVHLSLAVERLNALNDDDVEEGS
jgi:ParB-like chromosome segregation protein Spo0J